MSFKALSFIYDGVSSDEYCLKILNIGSVSGVVNSPLMGDVELISDRTRRRNTSFIYGTVKSALSFPITFGLVDSKLDRNDVRSIANRLIGTNKQSWLEIVQDDMLEVRYRGVFTGTPEIILIGNEVIGFSLTFQSDSPWAFSYEEIFSYDVGGETSVVLRNTGDDGGYYYPSLTILFNSVSSNFKIANTTDGREFSVSGFVFNENDTLYVDNDRKMITINGTPAPPLFWEKFNKKWLRFVPGDNSLTFVGNAKIKVSCMFPRKVGS